MAYDKKTVHTLLSGYARHTVLTLVYYLAQHDVEADVYADAARILQQAAEDRAAGENPGMHIECINGKMVEV
jgi:hypothetical protein